MATPTPPPTGHALAWDAERLWQRLQPLLPGISVEVVARCESTSSVLIERARLHSGWRDQPVSGPVPLDPSPPTPPSPHGRRAGDTQPCLLVAEHQTHGRGRMGRLWQSQPGSSLTFSLCLPLAPPDWSGLPLAVGVALADAIDPPVAGAAPRVGLKWPNDLWLLDAPGRGRKLGGVLIETVAVGRNRMAVIGVGLNIAPLPLRDVAGGFAWLRELWPEADAPAALHLVAPALAAALPRYERDAFAAFADAFERRDALRGQRVQTTAAAAREGVALGVGSNGALRIRDDAGQLHEIHSGEVSVRPLAERPAPPPSP
jgi:BirA family biotin operon repressor/biotin-[acetyl-CoA-carboxylase] ligase